MTRDNVSQDENSGEDMLSSEVQLVRILDRSLKSRYPEGVSLMQTLEDGRVMELHNRIRQPFSPYTCAKSSELKAYMWQIGRPLSLEPGGGITVRGAGPDMVFNIGRKFFTEAEEEYRVIHKLVSEALGK